MLQEATKAINSAFNNSFIKKLSQYLHDCVREEVKSSTFRNLKGDKDNKWIFIRGEEELFTKWEEYLRLDGSDSKLTELMVQSEMSQKDKYLIYGYLFIVGKSSKSKRQNEFLTPLLYMPCRLERNGVAARKAGRRARESRRERVRRRGCGCGRWRARLRGFRA